MAGVPTNYVQSAYDKAVDPDGNPTMRVLDYLANRLGLSTEVLRLVNEMTQELERSDAELFQIENLLLAMFAMGIIYEQDHGDKPTVYLAEFN